MATEAIAKQLAALPQKPGVYIMKNARGKVIYVGKAIVLRNRVRSYFQKSASHTTKTELLVQEVADIEWIVTGSELEALILEAELIRKYQPHYNIRLKDDKRYPYIKITWQEDYPHVLIVRRMLPDGAQYFGPFASSQAVHQTLELLRRLFPYRTCNREITGHDKRPCLYYHIKRCTGPCIGAIDKESYRAILKQAALFLEGKQEDVLESLRGEMTHSAETLQFERAAELRDTIGAVEKVIERQRIVSGHLHDHDFVAFARQDGDACVQVFFVRSGRLIGREYFVLDGAGQESEQEAVGAFIKQFYSEAANIPPEVLVPLDLDEMGVIQEWLNQRRGTKVVIKVPKRGDKRRVMNMARENATETLDRLRAEWEYDSSKHTEAIAELQQALNLPKPPSRIECYDISNTQGTNSVGSMVVFINGRPSKQDYRRFKIQTVQGANDFASMAEVLSRRLARAAEKSDQPGAKENRWALLPDLIILDGGKGQLHIVGQAIADAGYSHIPTVGLAKQNEELFMPGRDESVLLPRDSQALYLVQRVRDEAHRFAITYHRKLRSQESVRSALDTIPGVGPKRRQALLAHFGSVSAIKAATIDELAGVPGMNRKAAEAIAEML